MFSELFFFFPSYFYRDCVEVLQWFLFGCKISVNYAKNLQGKHEDFTDILCDLVTVGKCTDILQRL